MERQQQKGAKKHISLTRGATVARVFVSELRFSTKCLRLAASLTPLARLFKLDLISYCESNYSERKKRQRERNTHARILDGERA